MADLDSYKQQLREFYGRRTTYDYEPGTRHPLEAKLLLEFVPLQSGQKILDVATGTGLVAIPAAKKVGAEGYVIGIDITPGMLHQARAKITAVGLQNIELIEADADNYNFSYDSFDMVFCCEAIALFPDIPAIVQKFYRWLKTGGFVAFTVPPDTAYLANIYSNICTQLLGTPVQHMLEVIGTPEKCHELLQQAGFRDIEIKIEPSGRYGNFQKQQLSQPMLNFLFKANPLLANLSAEQLHQLQISYQAEIAKLTTNQGVWEDTTKFFVRAQK
jgi:ubiquinone/menaquinone biosynthesis C-methylase UbiE